MTKLITLVSAAAFAVASATAFAQGAGKQADAPKATPATPAQPAAGAPAQPATPATPAPAAKATDTKKAAKQAKGEPTKAQTRAGEPKGAAKGQQPK